MRLESTEQQLSTNRKGGYATLKLCFCDGVSDEFIRETRTAIEIHNKGVLKSVYPDSGFDLRVPNVEIFTVPFKSQFVNLGVKTSMSYNELPCGFLMYPRSSMSKTPLMLSNHTGIIDSGYRGPLIAAMRYLPCCEESSYTIDKHTRIVQICHPSLCPVLVLECIDSGLVETERGENGFGSTGK
jgi:dUTP pyrophosphatase